MPKKQNKKINSFNFFMGKACTWAIISFNFKNISCKKWKKICSKGTTIISFNFKNISCKKWKEVFNERHNKVVRTN